MANTLAVWCWLCCHCKKCLYPKPKVGITTHLIVAREKLYLHIAVFNKTYKKKTKGTHSGMMIKNSVRLKVSTFKKYYFLNISCIFPPHTQTSMCRRILWERKTQSSALLQSGRQMIWFSNTFSESPYVSLSCFCTGFPPGKPIQFYFDFEQFPCPCRQKAFPQHDAVITMFLNHGDGVFSMRCSVISPSHILTLILSADFLTCPVDLCSSFKVL